MSYDRILEQDRLVNKTTYSIKIDGVERDTGPIRPVTGSFRQTQCNRTYKFRPGNFIVNPITSWVRSLQSIDLGSDVGFDFLVMPENRWNFGEVFTGNLCRGFVVPPSNLDGFISTPVDTGYVLLAAAEKVAKPNADVALMLAESSETMAMLGGALNALRQPWKELLRIPRKFLTWNKKRKASYMSSRWLEYRYGIMPLVMDIDDLRRVYMNGIKRDVSSIHRCSSRMVVTNTTVQSGGSYSRSSPSYYRFQWRIVHETEINLTCHVYYRTTVPLDTLGFSLENIPSILWELVPYSFVVDWFFGIGQWLRAVMPKPGHDVLGNTVGIKRRYTYHCGCVDLRPITTFQWRYHNGNFPTHSFTDTWLAYTRSINHVLPSSPEVSYGLTSLKRVIDSTTLTWQKLANKSKR